MNLEAHKIIFVRCMASFAIGIASLAMIGHLIDNDLLTSWTGDAHAHMALPSAVGMSANAFAILLLSLGKFRNH